MTRPPASAAPGLTLTGERTLPGIGHERYWFARHVVAYRVAARRVTALARSGPPPTVLDAGCGEGYGLEMLASAGAGRVVGVDLDPAVVDHVRDAYARRLAPVEAVHAELSSLPLADGEVDLTVSLQVIEHLHDIPGFLASLRRVTRPGGELLLATPNRLTFTPGSDTPVNPFHTREFTARELAGELMAAGWEVVAMTGVHHGRRLAATERATGRGLGELLASGPPDQWPRWLAALVPRVRASWFRLDRRRLDDSLDLLARCRRSG